MITPYTDLRYCNMYSTQKNDTGDRQILLQNIGQTTTDVAYLDQMHSDIILDVTQWWLQWVGDAMITDTIGVMLEIRTADCVPILVAGRSFADTPVIWAIHSGRAGTESNIVGKTIHKMQQDYDLDISSCHIWVWPSACWECYEFGDEVYDKFDKKYIAEKEWTMYLDVSGNVIDQLVDAWVNKSQIQKSSICTITDTTHCYSYRRDETELRMHHRINITY